MWQWLLDTQLPLAGWTGSRRSRSGFFLSFSFFFFFLFWGWRGKPRAISKWHHPPQCPFCTASLKGREESGRVTPRVRGRAANTRRGTSRPVLCSLQTQILEAKVTHQHPYPLPFKEKKVITQETNAHTNDPLINTALPHPPLPYKRPL